MTHMNKDHPLFREVLGLGNRIVIPNLSLDGAYGMSVFEKAGFCSLVAVPITTYKVLGILGAADIKKRRFGNDIAQLLSVIASLVGVSLTKTTIMQKELSEKTVAPVKLESRIETNTGPETMDDAVIRREIGAPLGNDTVTNREPGYHIGNDMITNRVTRHRIGNTTDEKLGAFGKHARKMGKFKEQHK